MAIHVDISVEDQEEVEVFAGVEAGCLNQFHGHYMSASMAK